MKKFTITLFFATFATATFSQLPNWEYFPIIPTTNPYMVVNPARIALLPHTAKLEIGGPILFSNPKLYIYQSDNTSTPGTTLVFPKYKGLQIRSELLNSNSSSFNSLYGAHISATSNVSSETNSTYGLFVTAEHYNSTGDITGVFSEVSGGSANSRFSGYFTGGKFAVMSGNVGIETTNPQAALDIASSSANSIKIGKIGYQGNLNVPLNAVAAQFNIDFTGYRDISADQVGARIAAIRFNNHQANNALIQRTGLAFYTNPTGMNTGTTDLHERMRIAPDGNVGIGTTNPTAKLDVIGVIRATEVKVCLQQGCDFVFEEDYPLMSLKDLSTFITENKHLPEIAPAAVMESEGINLSEMNAKLLQKIEELTLYVIDLQKQIDELK